MSKKKDNKKNKLIGNIVFKVIAFISIVIMLVFCVYLKKLDMIPGKYLTIGYIVIGVIYLLLLLITLPRKIKTKFKVIAAVLFVIFGTVCVLGIKYADKTISFIDKINDELAQKEDYSLRVLADSKLTLDDIKDKKIGVYKNDNYDKVIENLKSTLKKTVEIVDYDDAVEMFEDLQEEKLDAVLVNGTLDGLLETELNYLKLSFKELTVVSVPIKDNIEETIKVVDVTNTPFNIYIAGGDAYGTINKVMNTDVNMVVSVDVKNHKLLLTSIPRDYYVVLPSKGENAYDKLTHAGYYGVGESVKAIEKLLGIEINYYAKVNFSTIEKVVDAIGGVDVYSDYTFKFADPSRGIYASFQKGWNHLNGKQALGFARERESFKDGDVQRVKHQQKVLDAVIKKISSSKTLIANYTDILDAVSSSFSTNLDTKSINRIVKMQLNDMKGWESESQNLVGTSAMGSCYSMPKYNLYIMKQDSESVKTAGDKIREFIGEKTN